MPYAPATIRIRFHGITCVIKQENAYEEKAPHKICAYIYDLANAFNRFYHETKILGEENAEKQKSYIALLKVTKDVLEGCIDVLGFEAPERM